jgi:hypothetical protein
MLLRIGYRKESFANVSADEVIKLEFTDNDGHLDLAISSYDVGNDRLIQCHAEHTASSRLDPKGRTNVDLDGLPEVEPVRVKAEGMFSYTNDAHREIRLESKEALQRLADRLVQTASERLRKTHKEELKQYARGRATEKDKEWLDFFAGTNNTKKWGWISRD